MRTLMMGLYEKALPDNLTWREKFQVAKEAGYNYLEMSVDESDHRLAYLKLTKEERLDIVKAMSETGIRIQSMCLSGHRRFPFGSHDEATRKEAYRLIDEAVELALDLGIRNIQLAGYDVYYEEQDEGTIARFKEGMQYTAALAHRKQVMVSVEIMDTAFMNSITKWKEYDQLIDNPWFTVYPDVGNLSAWGNDVEKEFALGINRVAALHLKDTYAVTADFPGQFRDVPFGEGCVDFVKVFQILAKLNYRGAFLVEMWNRDQKVDHQHLVSVREWLEARMKEGGFLC